MLVARKRGTKLHKNRRARASGRKRVLSVKGGPGVVDPPSPEATIFSATDLLTGANRQPATSSH